MKSSRVRRHESIAPVLPESTAFGLVWRVSFFLRARLTGLAEKEREVE